MYIFDVFAQNCTIITSPASLDIKPFLRKCDTISCKVAMRFRRFKLTRRRRLINFNFRSLLAFTKAMSLLALLGDLTSENNILETNRGCTNFRFFGVCDRELSKPDIKKYVLLIDNFCNVLQIMM